jgi:glycosyltransferase involved in cell wall biosynthesis
MTAARSQLRRVIIYTTSLLPYSETFVREQTKALRTWQPILVGQQRVQNGLSLEGLDVQILFYKNIQPLSLWAFKGCRELGLAYPPSVHRLRKINADLVHVHFATAAVDIWPVVRHLDVPMLVTLHGFDVNIHREWWERGRAGWRRRNYPRRLLAMASDPRVRFVAVSKAIKSRALEWGIPEEKIEVRYIGVDVARLKPEADEVTRRPKTILFVGRLVEKKGVEFLIRAFSDVQRIHPDANLIIVGGGPEQDRLKSLRDSLKARIIFTGPLAWEDCVAQMKRARIFCLPSVTALSGDAEGLGQVLLESQALGTPVITSARGGRDEAMIDGVTGLRFAEGDVAALRTALTSLLTDDDKLAKMAAAGPLFVREQFDILKCTADLERLYESVVGAHEDSKSYD